MMASDIPNYRPPRLDRAIQKDGAYESEPGTNIDKTSEPKGKLKGKEKDSDALPEGIALQPWDTFKKSKYSMPTEKLAQFVEGLLKEGVAGLTPQTQLEQTARIGAPRASAPAGPS